MNLLEYLEQDPDNLGFASMIADGNHTSIVEVINNPTIPGVLSIARGALEVFLIGQGIAAIAEIYAESAQTPMQLKVACKSLGKMLSSAEFRTLTLDDPATIAMRQGLVAGGVITTEQDTFLLTLGTRQLSSHGEIRGFGNVNIYNIADVLPKQDIIDERVIELSVVNNLTVSEDVVNPIVFETPAPNEGEIIP
jgi:hypothetical protein